MDKPPPSSPTPKLSDTEARLLVGMHLGLEDNNAGSFAYLAKLTDGGVEPRMIRRTVRALARKGLAKFHRGLWTEDGQPAGAGYGLTQAGRAAAEGRITP